ncbi:N-terminal fungal transcription regulatory domain-containing protein [Trichoderma longibrachiatum ATCC 18648]|uniref:N-terminal fungal transcription regulatory domain-containing protein n=1 Tax=Trichoderma longibrachiatum ATCC 18648 TaxID=983965 RepID=A0A2T4C181_TRILO|nr:N-terminal fungal transcription regulatory domain-containing protein [Trichoderma longibrachiatum ATCC 18648]
MPNYVPITPRPAQDSNGTASGSSETTENNKRRRVSVTVACNTCHRKKTRCDGKRPVCSACESSQSNCTYRDDSGLSEESQSLLQEVIRTLNSLPDDQVLERVRSLKREVDPSAILARLRGRSVTQQPNGAAEQNMMSDAFQTMELGPQFPNVYPPIPKLDMDTLEDAPYQQLIHATNKKPGEPPQGGAEAAAEQAQSLCDSRLEKLDISRWTNVNISNEYAARAISLYLETDHPLLGFFEPNQFVSDLIAGKTDHCSRLLVNALLYWSCQLYCAQDLESGSLTLAFCSEAESILNDERGNDSLLNLVALQFMSLGYLGQGRDTVVLTYLNEASEMAVRMGLFGVAHNQKQEEMSNLSEPERSAHLYAAWGSFNWITHMSLFYRQPGLQCPKAPPRLPIPGSQENQSQQSESESSSSSSPAEPDPPYMGGVFAYICQFWSILHELALLYRHKGPLKGDRRTLCFAEFKFRELLAWSNRLPRRLCRNDQSPHYVQILHIWLHAAILDLFRFSMSSNLKSLQLRTFTSPYSTPENVCIASARQLKQLIMNYRLNFASSSYTILWHTALTYLANAILQNPKEENWFFYFLLCVYGYERLRPCWRVTQAISTALISMALGKGDITSPTARQLLHDVSDNKGYQLPGDVRATFMMDLDLAASDPESASVEKIAQDFDQNLLLQQYTNIFDKRQKTDIS